MPWFVSDTTTQDIDHIMSRLKRDPETSQTYQEFQSLFDTNKWIIEKHRYWTLPHSYHSMNTNAPDLFQELFLLPDKCALVIFKGDLNYRKLLADCVVIDECRPFAASIGSLSQSRVPILALRTCKSDTITGLDSGLSSSVEKLDAEWLTNGKWGMFIEPCTK